MNTVNTIEQSAGQPGTPPKAKILVVDDDLRLRELLRRYLTEQGFYVVGAENAQVMNKLWMRERYDMLVLDLMLPGEDGLAICRRLRGGGDQTPIIMLTAKGEEVDRIIGLEMGTVYDALGSKVSVVEFTDGLIQGCDRDLVRPLQKRMEKRFEAIMLNTKVAKIEAKPDGIYVSFEGVNGNQDAPKTVEKYDRVLVSIGRRPNGHLIGAELAGVNVDERGFIAVDKQMRTNVPHIFAIGDIAGEPMLAHKASHEAKIAAEVIAGHKAFFDARTIPSVAYTDPEIAWMGLTETQAKAQGIDYDKAAFPWAASGRALSTGRDDGMTKVLFDKTTRRVLGAAIVGINPPWNHWTVVSAVTATRALSRYPLLPSVSRTRRIVSSACSTPLSRLV